MPDIAMCEGIDCPWKERCYRFTAEPSEYQSYFSKPPGQMVEELFTCDYFWGPTQEDIFKTLKDICGP
jgi:hypothetical protein